MCRARRIQTFQQELSNPYISSLLETFIEGIRAIIL